MRRALKIACAALAASIVVCASAAAAAGVSPPVADCVRNSHLTRHYSEAALQNALNTMPSDVREYSDCYNVIQSQLLAQLGRASAGGGSGGGSGGSFLPTPVIVAIVVLAIAALALGAVALARRRPRGP